MTREEFCILNNLYEAWVGRAQSTKDLFLNRSVQNRAAFAKLAREGLIGSGGELTAAGLTFSGLVLHRGEVSASIPFSRGKTVEIPYPGHPEVPALISSAWIGEGTLRLRCHAIGDAPCGFDMLVSVRDRNMTIRSRCSSDPLTREYDGIASGIRGERKGI